MLEIKKARNGLGIFTDKHFSSREELFEVTGNLISGDEDEDIDEVTRNNAFRFDADSYIDPGDSIGAYLNHSCESNAYISKKDNRIFVLAANEIQKGDEITIDYSTILAADDVWEMRCNCGSKVCRGIIRPFYNLPVGLQKRYIADNMVPQHILNVLQ